MKKVFTSEMLYEVQFRKDLLDQAGIPCAINNDDAGAGLGHIAFTQRYPELWVEDGEYPRAMELLEAFDRGVD